MILAFAHPGLVVPNLKKASRFYQQMFGFEVISKEGWEQSPEMDRAIGLKNSSCRGLMMKGHNCFLELFEYSNPPSETEPVANLGANAEGIRHLAFYVDDFHKAFTHLSELPRLAEFANFSAADNSSRSVVSHEMHPSVIDTPYLRVFRSPLNFWLPSKRLLSSIKPIKASLPAIY